MKVKWAISAVLATFLVFVMNSGSQAVNTRDIDKVRNKGVLDSEDLQTIDNFVGEAVQELAETKDFTSVAKVRTVILSRSNSERQSAEAQYAQQFSESAYKYISEAFKGADELTPEEHKFKVMVNLLILVDNLEDLRLADLAIGLLKDENAVIRYWAVHSVTNTGILEQLNSGESANLNLAKKIAERLVELVEAASPEMIGLMAEFATESNVPEGEDLLVRIADVRISKYADWTVEYELLDGVILKLLERKMSSGGRNKLAIARRFGQLYSCAMQRYVMGRGFLGDAQKGWLASVLVETEKSCIGKLLGMSQSVIKRAVEQGDYMTLLQEHSRLLGDETRAGQLGLKLEFDYGRNSDGTRRIAPLRLAEPPMTEASE